MAVMTKQSEFVLGDKQKSLFWDDRRYLCYVGGRGTGKSTSACMRLLGMVQRGEIKPGQRIVIIGPDYTQLMDGTLKTFDYWFDAAGLIVHKVNGNKPMRRLVGDIEVLCRSAMNPDQTRSKECVVVWLDEAGQMADEIFTLTNANIRPTGLRDPNQVYQTIITTTPRGKNWLYKRFVQDGSRFDDDALGYYHMTTIEAEEQGIARPGYVAELGYAPGSQMHRQEVLAEFNSWTGLVYRQDYKTIVQLPKLVYTAGAIDVGSITPSCILVGGVDERNAIYIFKEFYQPRALLGDIARTAGEWTREYRIRKWSVDNDLMWKMMRNGGMHAGPPNKTKDASGLMTEYVNNAIAEGRFHIDPACRGLLSELARYEYKDKTSGDEVTFLDKVKPNQDDHALDAQRYLLKLLSSHAASRGAGNLVDLKIG